MFPFSIGTPELIVLGVIALLLFGKRLPEVARSMGKGIVEFKKGIRGIEDEVNTSSTSYSNSSRTETSSTATRPTPPEERIEPTAPKFEPPTSAPS